MSFQGALWVKITHAEIDLNTLQQYEYFKTFFLEDCDFACLDFYNAGTDIPTDELEELSLHFNEAIFIGYHSSDKLFIYSHWLDGKVLRELSYTEDTGWTKVIGEAETWEAEFLFNEEALTVLLESFDEDMEEDALAARAIWEQQTLSEDSLYPRLQVNDLYYQLD